jgi:hypothetical protein
MESVLRSIRLGLRQMRRQPAFTATVVLTLGLAIGPTRRYSACWRRRLLRELPFRDPAGIVTLSEWSAGVDNQLVSPSSWAEW